MKIFQHTNLKNLNKLKNSLFLNPEDIELFEQIPEEYFSAILKIILMAIYN